MGTALLHDSILLIVDVEATREASGIVGKKLRGPVRFTATLATNEDGAEDGAHVINIFHRLLHVVEDRVEPCTEHEVQPLFFGIAFRGHAFFQFKSTDVLPHSVNTIPRFYAQGGCEGVVEEVGGDTAEGCVQFVLQFGGSRSYCQIAGPLARDVVHELRVVRIEPSAHEVQHQFSLISYIGHNAETNGGKKEANINE